MFAVSVYEKSGSKLSGEVWVGWDFPLGHREHPNGREVSSHRVDWQTYFPSRGRVEVTLDGATVLREDYDLCLPPLTSAAQHQPAGEGIGMVRLRMDPKELAHYAELPETRWLQIGPPSGRHVLQIKLAKIEPSDMFRDFSSGEYYVYGATRVVVQTRPQ